MPHGPKFGGGVNESIIHPLVLLLVLVGIALIFALPRKRVIIPVLVTTFLIPGGQQFYVAGVHLFVLRLLTLAAFIRIMMSEVPGKNSRYAGGWTSIDTAFVFYVVIGASATVMLYQDMSSIINQVGYLWDMILGYLVFRSLIQDEKDVFLAIKCFACLMVLLAIAMIYEQVKMVNLFGLLGGVDAVPDMRGGKIRSQGVFQHALTAGAFAGTSIPLFVLLWRDRNLRVFSIVGIMAASVMTVMTQTSTSLLTAAAGVFAIFMWPLRRRMKKIRTYLAAALIGLHLVMKAPVWFLIARIDLTGSSSSYHRAELINQFINHFSNWWLMGTKDVASWGWDMWDAQNMFVSVGEGGGLAALIFYILVISRGFARLGNARKRTHSRQQEWLLWLLGAAFFAHLTAFFGVNYFDQVRVLWFAMIAMICACTAPRTDRDIKGIPQTIMLQVTLPQNNPAGDRSCDPKPSVSALALRLNTHER